MIMRVRFLRGTALGGIGNDATPGDERDVPDAQARQLIGAGRAVAVAPVAPVEAPQVAPAETLPLTKSRRSK
jgi:hypothetical protein